MSCIGSLDDREVDCDLDFKKGGTKIAGIGTFTRDKKKFTLEGEIKNK